MTKRTFKKPQRTHFVRGRQWEVIGVREQTELKGTHLPHETALEAMRAGFYENGCTIAIVPTGVVGFVIDNRLIDDNDFETILFA